MKTKLKGLSTLLFALIMQISFAQQRTVSGTVVDQTGFALPGVNVIIKGTTTGVQTDIDGKYQISASPDQVLVFSYIGMLTQEIPASSASINVTLRDDTTELETVVITAVGIRREKASIGAATTTISSGQMTKGSQPNIADAIKGKVAGVVVSNASTDPGASSGVIIRGFSSISGSNQPLYVVDGIPINDISNNPDLFGRPQSDPNNDSLGGGADYGNGAADINPNDIESMTILKGASATALYGARAANGVIMITTKKGKTGKMAVDFNTTTFFTSILRTPKYQSSFGQGWDGIHYLNENGSWGPAFDGVVRPWGNVVDNSQRIKPYSFQEDQLENFFTTGTSKLNTISVSGGSGESTVRLSYSNTQQDGIYPTDADSFERNTVSLSGTSKVNKISIAGSLNYVNTNGGAVATGQGVTVYNNLMQIPTDIPITEFQDYNNPFNNVSNYYTPYGITNPYFTLDKNGTDYNKERFYGSMEFTYDINSWSSATYRFGLDVSSDLAKAWTARIDAEPGSPNDGSSTETPGSYSESANMLKQLNHDILYNMNFDLSEKFDLASTFGFNINIRQRQTSATSVASQDIPDFYSFSNSTQIPQVFSEKELRKLFGFYNSTTVSYLDQLYLTANIRNDWYSTLPEKNRSVLYGGVNTSWIFTNTFPNIKNVINYGKFRAGYGETGVDTDPYQVLSVYTPTATDDQGFAIVDFPINGINAYGVGDRAENEDLQAERRKEFEVGMEASFLDNLISIDFTYYNAKVENQILALPLAPSSGYTSQRANIGTISNEGIEALLVLNPIRSKTDGFDWKLSLNYTTNNTELEELDPRIAQVRLSGLNTTSLIAREGEAVGLIYGSVPERDPNGNIVVDANGIPVASPIKEVYGDTQYDYTMGIGNVLSYKGVTLDFTFDIRQGGLMYSRTADITRFTGNSVTTTYNDRQPFIVPGSVVKITDDDGNVTYEPNTTVITSEYMDDYYRSDASSRSNVIDKSFVKLREVILSYSLPSKVLDGTYIEGISVSLIGRNLFIWTPRSNQYIDPEASTFGTDLGGQFGEFSANPSTRSLGFSIKANF